MCFTVITGGARSGKSSFAEKLAKKFTNEKDCSCSNTEVLYIATAIPYDAEMEERIRRHQNDRPSNWRTVEQYLQLDQVIKEASEQIILLDCITILLTNLMFATEIDENNLNSEEAKRIEGEIQQEIDTILNVVGRKSDKEIIFVTNEVGLGLVPTYPLGRIFRDIAGRVNQKMAEMADQVYFVVSGIPILIKGVD